jgi:hypothetical protein
MKKKKEEYGKSYLTEFAFGDSLGVSEFNKKLAGYFGLMDNDANLISLITRVRLDTRCSQMNVRMRLCRL